MVKRKKRKKKKKKEENVNVNPNYHQSSPYIIKLFKPIQFLNSYNPINISYYFIPKKRDNNTYEFCYSIFELIMRDYVNKTLAYHSPLNGNRPLTPQDGTMSEDLQQSEEAVVVKKKQELERIAKEISAVKN
jgi:type I site-specific restriction-modification system R (restriction) subunit